MEKISSHGPFLLYLYGSANIGMLRSRDLNNRSVIVPTY